MKTIVIFYNPRAERGLTLAGIIAAWLKQQGLKVHVSTTFQAAGAAFLPEADLLVEDRSSNTFQNVELSRAILEQRGLLDGLGTVLLVSSEWHMRRVLLTMARFFPARLRLVCCPTTEDCSRATWAKSPPCRQIVLRELLLLETLRQVGAI